MGILEILKILKHWNKFIFFRKNKRMSKIIYTIVLIVIFTISYYIYTSYTEENYTPVSCNLITVDGNGNMTTVAVTSPSLLPIGTSNVVYVDESGNIGLISPKAIIMTTPKKYVNLLTVDSNNNFSTISSNMFNGCRVNSDEKMNGTPQLDGSCTCRNFWSNSVGGDGCGICDWTTDGSTHMDGSFGSFAGSDCQFSQANCSGAGFINGQGNACKCRSGYTGNVCQYSRATCNNNGTPQNDGSCVCDAFRTGAKCETAVSFNFNFR